MTPKAFILTFFFAVIITSCSKNIDYSQEHINQTSGRYLYSPDEVIDVYYNNNKLFLKWRGADFIEPVVLDKNTFFVADMYKKLRFVQHPETKKRFLSVIPEGDSGPITYDYLKVADSFKTPSMYLKAHEYDKALQGFLEIKKQDSTSSLINENDFNTLGYKLLRNNENENAINMFKMNTALYPESENAYDSLADAYLRNGDSLQAYINYEKALELNTGNKRAKKYIAAYKKSND
ncbi:tetratricopeptide repeat protein [Xanthomarina sp. GH4-25]|uniref:tetratricopeptide repeat protein n=1 Tax=Xanthomarina sp. GH4-25 TaxID=3349335 RepID=UPI0038783215